MGIHFSWHDDKDLSNQKKHGVSFEEARTIFGDTLVLTVPDLLHSVEEQRFFTVGISDRGRVLAVSHTEDEMKIRIISARLATPKERRDYEHGE